MSMFHKHVPTDYTVGDKIYISVSHGWNRLVARQYEVTKITPTGQIVAQDGDKVIRINAKGSVNGSESRVIDLARAMELREQERIGILWDKVRLEADRLTHSSRQRDKTAIAENMLTIQRLISQIGDAQ